MKNNQKGTFVENEKLNSTQHVINIKKLSKIYSNTIALENVSFKARKGEILCIIGPNGAGKSTLVKLITGQISPTSGNIIVNNKDPILERKKLFGTFGLVPQEISLYNELTGRENLIFHARLYRLSKYKINQKVDEMLEIAGLTKRQNDRVNSYSGGMKRRLQLVRALLHEPEIIVLDEPTLGIDVQSRKAIHDYIYELPKLGKTILLTTNYMEEAERLADRIIILDTKIITGPGRFHEIQENMFPNTIIEFKTSLEKNYEDFIQQFLLKDLYGKILSEKKLSEQYIKFQIMFDTNNVENLIEKFIDYTTSHQISLEEFTLKKPSLEDIFIKLTGKEFRE